jgi:hypothetical protein
MNPIPYEPRTLITPCKGAVRVLVMHHIQDDTYAISEDGEVSLSGKADLIQLLNQLSGRDHP